MASVQNKVVVITGASSGIGRAAAHAFAREGAHLVLVARREAALEEAAAECRSLGAASACATALDVVDAQAVDALATRVYADHGRIDVWINNAGVVALGGFDSMPPDAFKRVMDVNFYGYVHGARAALRHFRRQGSGVLINNASILGFAGWPYASPYVASKYAIRGLSECLREELVDARGIHVCTVMPATIDTPIFLRGANYTTYAARAVPPVYDPQRVARAMVALARKPKRERIVGGFGLLVALGKTIAPSLVERFVAWSGPWLQFRRTEQPTPAQREGGNLQVPLDIGGPVRGGWKRHSARLTAIAAGLAVAGIATLAAQRTIHQRAAPRREEM